ncbi:MAG TPA: exostosin family protein [Clostridiaceae bacterium]|jgi:hypothetical protein|nr:exostosin family protein [Clostridiaceae bacterium]
MLTKVLITSLDNTEKGNRTHENKLLEIYQKSNKKYTLVDNPEEAHIILIGNVDDKTGEKILANPILKKFPEKSFSLSDTFITLFLNRGIYTSANTRSLFGWRRIRTGSYTLLPDEFINPFIKLVSNQLIVEKKFLFSFIGRNCHPVRNRILNLAFQRRDILIEDSSKIFDLWKTNVSKEQKQFRFAEILAQSKFSLCPRGAIANSIRLFESLQMGVAPIIIADAFLLPKGPDWAKFSIIIKEKDIDQLEKIVSSCEANYAEMGALAKQCYDNYFSEDSYFNYVVDNCLDIQKTQIIPEKLYWQTRHLYLSYLNLKKWIIARL